MRLDGHRGNQGIVGVRHDSVTQTERAKGVAWLCDTCGSPGTCETCESCSDHCLRRDPVACAEWVLAFVLANPDRVCKGADRDAREMLSRVREATADRPASPKAP